MRNPDRIDKMLTILGNLWKKYPDLRLGQLICNVYHNPYYVEDDTLIEGLIKYYNELERNVQILKEIRNK